MAVLAKTDGTKVNLISVPNIEEARKLIGGWVERVCPLLTPDIIFLCDEEGHLKKLPLNGTGEMLYGQPIAGDIIVMSRDEAKKAGWL